jgi:hypothetical protein
MIRAKPLIWTIQDGWLTAKTIFGTYKIRDIGDAVQMFPPNAKIGSECWTLKEAKAAAQAHADQLVRDMTQPVTRQDAAQLLLDEVFTEFAEAIGICPKGFRAVLRILATPPQEKDDA